MDQRKPNQSNILDAIHAALDAIITQVTLLQFYSFHFFTFGSSQESFRFRLSLLSVRFAPRSLSSLEPNTQVYTWLLSVVPNAAVKDGSNGADVDAVKTVASVAVAAAPAAASAVGAREAI